MARMADFGTVQMHLPSTSTLTYPAQPHPTISYFTLGTLAYKHPRQVLIYVHICMCVSMLLGILEL